MAKTKIVDEGEVKRWIEEGKTYDWMVRKYKEKYNIETVPSMWSNFRRRRGLERRIFRDDDLIPWAVKREHRWRNQVAMLRAEARRRAGAEVSESSMRALRSWLESMEEGDIVVHYDPDTEEGFFYVPRRPGTDTDLIRKPDFKTTTRRNAD